MATGIFEITLDLYTVSSSLIETKTFYTVFVDIGIIFLTQDKNNRNYLKKKVRPHPDSSILTKLWQ